MTVRGSVENYLYMSQNVIAPAAAAALVDLWLDLPHDPASNFGVNLQEIAAYESR